MNCIKIQVNKKEVQYVVDSCSSSFHTLNLKFTVIVVIYFDNMYMIITGNDCVYIKRKKIKPSDKTKWIP